MVAHGAHKAAGIILELLPKITVQPFPRRGGNFDELLMIALNGTIAFVKGEDVAVHVGNDLNLDMTDVRKKFFHKKTRIAKGGLGHGGGLEKGVFQLRLIMDGKDAPAASPAFRLEHDGETHFIDEASGGSHIHGAIGTGYYGNAQLSRDGTGLHLVPQQIHGLGGSADESQPRVPAALRKTGVLRSEAPAGMDANDAALTRLVNDAINIKIGARIRAEQDKFLRGRGGRRGFVHICRRHGGDSIDALPDGSADAPRRDTTVGDKYGLAPQKLLNFRKCLVGHSSALTW